MVKVLLEYNKATELKIKITSLNIKTSHTYKLNDTCTRRANLSVNILKTVKISNAQNYSLFGK